MKSILIRCPIDNSFPLQIRMRCFVSHTIKTFSLFRCFTHLDDITAKMVALFPMKTKFIFKDTNIFKIVNGHSQINFIDRTNHLIGFNLVTCILLYYFQKVITMRLCFVNGIGKIFAKISFGCVSESDQTVSKNS